MDTILAIIHFTLRFQQTSRSNVTGDMTVIMQVFRITARYSNRTIGGGGNYVNYECVYIYIYTNSGRAFPPPVRL